MRHRLIAAMLASAAMTHGLVAQQGSITSEQHLALVVNRTVSRAENASLIRSDGVIGSFSASRMDTAVRWLCDTCVAPRFTAMSLRIAETSTGSSRGTHVVRGAVIGALVGVPLGALFGRYEIYAGKENSGGNPAIGAVLGFVVGALAGAGIGAALPASFRGTTSDLR